MNRDRKKESIIKSLKRLWKHVSIRRQRQFKFLIIFMLFTSLAEIVSIGAVLPFLGVITNPEIIFNNDLLQPLIVFFNINDPKELILPLTVIFIIAAITSGLFRIILLRINSKLSFATGSDMSINIYRRTLYQNYEVHSSRNSSELISGVSTKADALIYSIILPFITLISSSAMMVAILVTLLIIDPNVALSTFGGFGIVYFIISLISKKRLALNSNKAASMRNQVVKSLQEGLGGIRDVLINNTQEVYADLYKKADVSLREAQASSVFITLAPRYAIEALGMVVISLVALFLTRDIENVVRIIPVLGALALGAQRLLPIMQQGYAAWSQISDGHASLIDVLEFLDQPLPNYINQTSKRINFEDSIELVDIEFAYHESNKPLFFDLNLRIKKGSRIGFIGPTGCGKSTLLDIIMGLLSPSSGKILIDGIKINDLNKSAWQSQIAHVPQDIFLADATISENIALGTPKKDINFNKIEECVKQAQLSEVISNLPQKYNTNIGERGIRLSGGQKQRIGIARALYREATLIIFDEATSALDSATETDVMSSIDSLSNNLTLLMIAHRISTLKNCDFIVELSEGRIEKIGKYDDFM
mgnify:CR=1 FL=1